MLFQTKTTQICPKDLIDQQYMRLHMCCLYGYMCIYMFCVNALIYLFACMSVCVCDWTVSTYHSIRY